MSWRHSREGRSIRSSRVNEPRVYYGEGSQTMAFCNVDRHEGARLSDRSGPGRDLLPATAEASASTIDSLWKRMVFGWRSGKFFELVFSRPHQAGHARALLPHTGRSPRAASRRSSSTTPTPTRSHVDGQIVWIVNAMTTSDRYPYSLIEELGDKSDERSPFPRPTRWVNYVEDSVKGDGRRRHRRDHVLQDQGRPRDPRVREDLSGLFTAGVDRCPSGVRAQIDISDAAAAHAVRRSLHLLPHERRHVLLQHGRHVGRRRRGARADPRHRQGDHVLDRAVPRDARHRQRGAAGRERSGSSTRSRWSSRRRRR